jgi:hypothetical protein
MENAYGITGFVLCYIILFPWRHFLKQIISRLSAYTCNEISALYAQKNVLNNFKVTI